MISKENEVNNLASKEVERLPLHQNLIGNLRVHDSDLLDHLAPRFSNRVPQTQEVAS